MSVPPVTVGLPVYNGGEMLGECLACLAGQTFVDFRVLIHDNASTDETSDRCADMAARDARFVHLRHPENIGPAANFAGVMRAAESPFFLWRAHDDLSAPTYLEVLTGLLQAAPSARLAVADVLRERIRPGKPAEQRRIAFRLGTGATPAARLRATLPHVHPGWFYGMWRRDAVTAVWDEVLGRYPHAWASDLLMLFRVLCADGIVGSGETHFQQRLVSKASAHSSQRAPEGAAEMARRRALFVALCREWAGVDAMPLAERWRMGWAIERFAERRAGRRMRILKARLREGFAR